MTSQPRLVVGYGDDGVALFHIDDDGPEAVAVMDSSAAARLAECLLRAASDFAAHRELVAEIDGIAAGEFGTVGPDGDLAGFKPADQSSSRTAPRERQQQMTNHVPAALVALELGCAVADLLSRLDVAEHVTTDAETRFRVLPAELSRRLIDEQAERAAAAKAAERQRQAEFDARMAEINRNLPPLRGGVSASSGSAFADLVAVDQR